MGCYLGVSTILLQNGTRDERWKAMELGVASGANIEGERSGIERQEWMVNGRKESGKSRAAEPGAERSVTFRQDRR
jgi:hypothetical protein